MTIATIRASEAAHFDSLAAEWWDPRGSSAMLHRLNPARLGYIRGAIDTHFGGNSAGTRPLAGKRALDVGCGAGLLTEPLARLGAAVIGVDAAGDNIAVAARHAEAGGLSVEYRHGDIGNADFATALGQHDLVTCLEVIEHVDNPSEFVAALAERLTVNGLMILSTPNRTAASQWLLVRGAEMVGAVPAGTHDWSKFVTPDELQTMAEATGLRVVDVSGLSPDVRTRRFRAGGTMALDYLMTLVRG